MKVKYIEVARLLKKPAGTISMAVARGKLNKTLDNRIDLDDATNHAWICKRLAKQGCEIPQEISALFQATPITENEKSKGNVEAIKPPASAAKGGGAASVPVPPDGAEVAPVEVDPTEAKAARDVITNARVKENALTESAVAKAEQEKIKAAEARKELIRINPFGRLLFNVKSAERTQVSNAIPNIAQLTLDDIKSALNDKKSDTEIIMQMQERWKIELNKIYVAIDRELKSKIRQAKNQLIITDDDETEEGMNNAA